MKSYFEKQRKIDIMKPIERLDYFNREDRIRKRFSYIWTLEYAKYLIWFSISLIPFSFLLFSIETNNSMIAFFIISELFIKLFFIGILFLIFAIFEITTRRSIMNKYLNELDKKYKI